jgi:beta-glucosidase
LSYTRFEYSNLRLDRDRLGPNDTLHASVDVRNVGERDGDEVVQAYARRVESSVPMPLKQLVAFRRVRVPAGQVRTVSLAVRASELRHWDEARNRFLVEAAPCELQVGASSADIRAKAGFRIQ